VASSTKDALLSYCRSLPGSTEDVKWGEHLVFSVGGKMFAIFDVSDAEPVRLKVDSAVFPILTQQPGISPAPYLARQSWIRLEHTQVLPSEAMEDLLRESYELVAAKLPKRVRERLESPGEVPPDVGLSEKRHD
jgi:predicted DNA-binding protein (MmcQ/YjbR family)